MIIESECVNAGGLMDAALMLGIPFNDDLHQMIGVSDVQTAFNGMVPLEGSGDWEDWI